MNMQDDLAESWKFFKQMWNNYKIASGSVEKSAEKRAATLKVIMGKDCFRVLQNLNPSAEDLAIAQQELSMH